MRFKLMKKGKPESLALSSFIFLIPKICVWICMLYQSAKIMGEVPSAGIAAPTLTSVSGLALSCKLCCRKDCRAGVMLNKNAFSFKVCQRAGRVNVPWFCTGENSSAGEHAVWHKARRCPEWRACLAAGENRSSRFHDNLNIGVLARRYALHRRACRPCRRLQIENIDLTVRVRPGFPGLTASGAPPGSAGP